MDNERRKLKQAGLFLAQPEDIQPVHRRTTRADIVENDFKEPVCIRQAVALMSMINPRSNGTRRSDNLIDMNDGLNRSVACRQQLVESASRVGVGDQRRSSDPVNDVPPEHRIDSKAGARQRLW